MEAIEYLLRRTNIIIETDINDLVNKYPEASDTIDNIRISLAAQATSLKLMIEDKARLQLIDINMDNRLHFTNNSVVCALVGSTKNQNTTNIAAKFSIAWGENHCLNIVKDSVLSNKTKDNTLLLGLIALINQIIQLKLKKVLILTNHQNTVTTFNSIEMFHAMGYVDMDRNKMKDDMLLQMLYQLRVSNDIKIEMDMQNILPLPLREPFNKLLKKAKAQLDEAWKTP